MKLSENVRWLTLFASLLVMASCANHQQPSPSWPHSLNVIRLADGGVCMDAESARKLATLKAELEKI
ncbi:hypothetical protein GCM10007894_12090 [Paraferrimonas haliotis]|uniref:Uncharacterized protein n=1 Tax=Paraferrimonas haliotis TaxID=2013866 RepID=A0AA37TS00_9GAMM|nr:hypothetical protein GCM10007894_12090 [Paraferrimonas haliotis]